MNQLLPFLFCVFNLLITIALSRARNLTVPSPAQFTPTSPVGKILVQDEQAHLDRDSVLVIVFVSLVVALIILSACCAFYFWQRMGLVSDRKKVGSTDTSRGQPVAPILNHFNPMSIRGSIPEVEYRLIEAATNGFSENDILGRGTFGCVYKAGFNLGASVAVKKLDAKEPYCESVFENEMSVLSNTTHPNIISLLGYCVHRGTRFLVYELMQGGSLEKQLHGPSRGMALTWNIRVKIALDVARGLEYLHEHCSPPVIHRDLNSSSILLDSNNNAKISGFGHAVAGGSENEKCRKQRSSICGYEAPEYLGNGELTEKSDVYALGVVMLELLVGKKPVEELAGSQCQSFTAWVLPQLADRDGLPDIVDPVIRRTMDLKHLCQVAAIASLCVQPEPSYRPLMKDVVYSLIPLVPQELGGSPRITESRV